MRRVPVRFLTALTCLLLVGCLAALAVRWRTARRIESLQIDLAAIRTELFKPLPDLKRHETKFHPPVSARTDDVEEIPLYVPPEESRREAAEASKETAARQREIDELDKVLAQQHDLIKRETSVTAQLDAASLRVQQMRDVSISTGAASVALAGVTFGLYQRQMLSRLRKGLCIRCGYDLCGTPDRCPECGLAATTPSHAASRSL